MFKDDLKFFVDALKMRLKIISRSLDKFLIIFDAFGGERRFATEQVRWKRCKGRFLYGQYESLQVCVGESNADSKLVARQ